MLDDVLVDGLDERVVADSLDEDGAVVVARRGGHVHLERKAAILLEHLVVDVLDGLEPGHARVVDVVGLVVEDSQFLDLADEFAEVGLAVGGAAGGFLAEGVGEEVIAQVVVLEGRLAHVGEEDAVDVREEEIARVAHEAHVVLDVESELEIVAPVAAVGAVGRQHGVVEEDAQAVEVGAEAVQHDDVGRDDEEVAREGGVGFVKFVEEAPGEQERDDLGLARPGCELEDIARPVLGEHAGGDGPGGVEAEEVEFVARPFDFVQPDDRLDGLALGEVVAEVQERAVGVFGEMLGIEPVAEQGDGGGRSAGVALSAPGMDLGAHLGDERREEFLIGGGAEVFVGGKPAVRRDERRIGRGWELRVQGHVRVEVREMAACIPDWTGIRRLWRVCCGRGRTAFRCPCGGGGARRATSALRRGIRRCGPSPP